MSDHPVIESMTAKMRKTVEHTLHEFSSLHTGKASPSMVEGIHVQAYGSNMRLKEIAAITTPDSRTIQIQPWDKSVIKDIEKAIQTSKLGITPAIDGAVIRLPIPELSRERRQELTKLAQGMAEEGRVAVRHARREALDSLKTQQKNSEISEDDLKRFEKEVQQLTDKHIAEIDEHFEHKEKELMAI